MACRVSNNEAMDSLFNTVLIGLGRLLTAKSQTSFQSSVMILLSASWGPPAWDKWIESREEKTGSRAKDEQVATDGTQDKLSRCSREWYGLMLASTER